VEPFTIQIDVPVAGSARGRSPDAVHLGQVEVDGRGSGTAREQGELELAVLVLFDDKPFPFLDSQTCPQNIRGFSFGNNRLRECPAAVGVDKTAMESNWQRDVKEALILPDLHHIFNDGTSILNGDKAKIPGFEPGAVIGYGEKSHPATHIKSPVIYFTHEYNRAITILPWQRFSPDT
jgi:hypothetical protein